MNIDLRDLVERDAVLAPVVELGGVGGGMRRHLACLLERATVLEVGGDAGAAEGVVAHLGGDVVASSLCPSQSDTFRMSCVAQGDHCAGVSQHVWRDLIFPS